MLAGGTALAAGAPPGADAAGEAVRAAQRVAGEVAQDARAKVESDPWFWGNLIAAGVVLAVLWGKDVIRPGSLARAGIRNVKPHAWVVYLACALLAWFMPQVCVALLQMLSLDLGPREGAKFHAAAALAAYPAGIAVAALLARLVGMSAPASGFRWCWGDLPRGMVLGAIVFPLTQAAAFGALALHERLGGGTPDRIAHDTLRMLLDHPKDPWVWTAVGMAVVGAPVLEELQYRGFLQSAMLRAWGRPGAAVLGSAAVFTASHIGVGPWYGLVPIFVLAVGLGVAMEWSKSIVVPVGMHVLFNAANVVLALVIGA